MVMMVLWGLVSPQLLQKIMALYIADLELLEAGRLDVSGIHKMARLGDHGNLPNHCWRDLKRILPAVELPFVPCCPLCPVGLEANLMWWNFRPPAAAWIDHFYSVQSWLARGLNASYMGAYI